MSTRSAKVAKIALQGLLILGGWGLYALFGASQSYFSRAYQNRVPWKPAFQYSLIDSVSWALLTPLIFLFIGWLVVRPRNWWWTIPALIAGGIGFAFLHLQIFIR